MVKILHFVSTPAISSGVMSTIMNYYRYVDRSRVQFDFLCFVPDEQTFETEIYELGGRVFFVSKPGSSLSSLRELEQFFQEHASEYLAVHNHEVYLSFYLGPLVKRMGISRFIIHSHATRYSDKKLSAIRNCILCLPIRIMKCEKMACSKDAGRFLFGKKSMENGSVQILHNAISTQKYQFHDGRRSKIRKKLELEDYFVIGHVGRFMPQKNHGFLIDVFADFLKEMPKAHLVLIGDGPGLKQIKRKCQNLGIRKQVTFLGRCKNVAPWYSSMDAFLFPSVYEGIGIALLEAQANGLPCVVSDQVPAEAKVTEQVTFLPLRCKDWKDELSKLSLSCEMRGTPNQIQLEDAFSKKNYKIERESRWLQEYYENTDTDVRI